MSNSEEKLIDDLRNEMRELHKIDIDLRKSTLELIGERLERRTLGHLREYEAAPLAALTYINTIVANRSKSVIDPQLIIDYYMDYLLSAGSMGRRDLIELFKSMVGSPIEKPHEEPKPEKKRLKII